MRNVAWFRPVECAGVRISTFGRSATPKIIVARYHGSKQKAMLSFWMDLAPQFRWSWGSRSRACVYHVWMESMPLHSRCLSFIIYLILLVLFNSYPAPYLCVCVCGTSRLCDNMNITKSRTTGGTNVERVLNFHNKWNRRIRLACSGHSPLSSFSGRDSFCLHILIDEVTAQSAFTDQ